jgi:hypothetical protein
MAFSALDYEPGSCQLCRHALDLRVNRGGGGVVACAEFSFPPLSQAHSPVHFLSFVSVRRYCAQLPARAPVIVRIASWWKKSPLVVAVALGLLANCALHAAAISGGLAIVWLVEQLRAGSAKTSESRRKLLLCAMIVLGFYAFAIWTAWPPNDLVYLSFSRAAKPSFLHSALASVLAPICQPVILSIPFWIAIVFVFGARRSLLYLLPVLFFAAFSGNVIGYFWHWGLVVPLLICLLWITWSSPGADMSLHEFVGRAALIYMVGVQIIWSAYALNFDHYSAYSPNLTTAQFLRPRVEAGATIAVTYLDESHSPFAASHIFSATGILPYFDRSIYINQSYPFYWWSEKNKSDELFYALLPSHPSVVVAEALQVENGPAIDLKGQRAELLRNSGYQLTNVFCGSLPFRMELVLTNCHVIFQRSDSRQEPSGIAPGPTSAIK